MVTLKQLFQVFGHDPKWGRLATQSAQPMVSVFMRKLGDTDITTLTDFDIEMQLAMSEQPEDRKVKARSCMHYLLRWTASRAGRWLLLTTAWLSWMQLPNRKLGINTQTYNDCRIPYEFTLQLRIKFHR